MEEEEVDELESQSTEQRATSELGQRAPSQQSEQFSQHSEQRSRSGLKQRAPPQYFEQRTPSVHDDPPIISGYFVSPDGMYFKNECVFFYAYLRFQV